MSSIDRVEARIKELKMSEELSPLPQHWVGMFNGYKRDAMYLEKCLKDLRAHYGGAAILNDIAKILRAEYEPKGVDLDKPNFGMFE